MLKGTRKFGSPRKRSETSRVRALPTRPPELGQHDLTDRLVLPGSTWELKPVQSWALAEIEKMGKLSTPEFGYGCLLPIGVGHGKTFVSYAAPVVLGIEPDDVLVLAPASLRSTFEREGIKYARECATPPQLPFMSYDELSHENSAFALRDMAPKLIVCDEAHHIRDPKTARGRRFYGYLKRNPHVIVVAMTGTMLSKSLRDVAPMASCAMGDRSPLPREYNTLESWSLCVDVPRGNESMPQTEDYRRFAPVARDMLGVDLMAKSWADRKVLAREAFHERFVQTPGVVYTAESSAPNGLILEPIQTALPAELQHYIEDVETSWKRPDGVELDDELRVSEVMRMLALGYFYRWEWGEAGEDVEWNEARLDYAREVRAFLKRPKPGIDSPALVAKAIRGILGEFGPYDGPTFNTVLHHRLIEAYAQWWPIRDRANPEAVPVILDRSVLARVADDFNAQVGRNERGMIWYEHGAAGDIFEALGYRVYRAGDDPEIDPNRPGTVAAASIKAHGTGKQLQAWNRFCVVSPPANGQSFEQLIARHHRPGQPHDDVFGSILVHTPEYKRALRKARLDAEFAEATQGQAQKLNIATWKPARFI